MIEVVPVSSKKQMHKFVSFPLKLYKESKFYVPSFFGEELKLYDKDKNVHTEYSDSYFFLAYKDGKITGRIGAIVNYADIKKTGKKQLRFTRFDVINDYEVAKALFDTIEDLAKSLNFTAVHGPWGYNDLDKEGMLTEGFDYIATYATIYNYDYYPHFMEKLGYKKEVEWIERLVTVPDEVDKKEKEFGDMILRRYKLREAVDEDIKISKLLDEYGPKVFELLDICYKDLHGVVPLTKGYISDLLSQLKLVLSPRYISVIVDEKDDVVGFGVSVRSFAKALNECKGKFNPLGILKILKSLKHSDVIELLIVGVHPDYQNKGILPLVFSRLQNNYVRDGIKYAETNCTLEDNIPINNVWDKFPHVKHKRRKCFIKEI